jgi:hypothetical protein
MQRLNYFTELLPTCKRTVLEFGRVLAIGAPKKVNHLVIVVLYVEVFLFVLTAKGTLQLLQLAPSLQF